MAVNESVARIWSPYKEILQHVVNAIVRKQKDSLLDLEMTLRRNKPLFLNLLSNPPRNATFRNAVMKAETVGLPTVVQTTQTFTRQFIEEALILSDLFSLDEYAAVELLIAGENQMSLFPGLTRGMIATLLYYDGRACLVLALKLLLQARDGLTWAMGATDEVTSLVTKFTDQLMADGLFDRLLVLLAGMDATKEIHALSMQSALGPPRHRRQVIDKIHEVENSLAECVFCWAGQNRLSRGNTLLLLRHLSTHAAQAQDASLDRVTLTLLMAALYAIDVRVLEQEDSEEYSSSLPIVSDDQFVKDVHDELTSDRQWVLPGVKVTLQFAWSLTLFTLDQFHMEGEFRDFSDRCELVIDGALDNGVVEFVRTSVVTSEHFHQEEYFVRQLHAVLTDFLSLMPSKVKELRTQADDVSRVILANQQAGLEPPTDLPRHFEHLLLLIGDLYIKDNLQLALGLDYWYPADALVKPGMRPTQKQVNLFKFVRLASDMLLPPMFVPYLHMLRGLANSPQGAHQCFSMLMSNSSLPGSTGCSISWHHFFGAFVQYYNNLRQETPVTYDLSHVYHYPSGWRGITPQEAEGMAAVLRLMRTILKQDEVACLTLAEHHQWMPLVTLLGLVGCSVPPKLKAELIHVLAAFARTAELANSVWMAIESAQLLPAVITDAKSKMNRGGLGADLDEVEPSLEEYPMALAFLDLIDSLTNFPIPPSVGRGHQRQSGFELYLDFIRDTIFYKFLTRAYKDPGQKWEVGAAVLKIFSKLLYLYDVVPADFVSARDGAGRTAVSTSAGFSLMLHMLTDSQTVKLVLFLIDEGTKLLSKYAPFPGKASLEALTLHCLKMVETVMLKQGDFVRATQELNAATMVAPLDKLLMNINPRSGKPDHLVNISRFVTFNATLPRHALCAVKVLCLVIRSSIVPLPLLMGSEVVTNELRHGFVESLECDDVEDIEAAGADGPDDTEDEMAQSRLTSALRQQVLLLLVDTLEQPSPNFAHFLLGFDVRKSVDKTVLQNPGILGTPRSCLHSLLLIVSRGVMTAVGGVSQQQEAQLAATSAMPSSMELAYRLIYALCANRDTSVATMRYLRTTDDFFHKHLQCLPYGLAAAKGQDLSRENALVMLCQSWLLRSAAVELRVTALSKQRSHLQRLITLLTDDAVNVPDRGASTFDKTGDNEMTRLNADYTFLGSRLHKTTVTLGGSRVTRKLVAMLDAISLVLNPPPQLRSAMFPPNTVMQVALACEQVNEFGVKFINVKSLRKLLTSEVNAQVSLPASQRSSLLAEVKDICEQITTHNAYLETLHARTQLLDGWRQVTETLLAVCPEDVIPTDAKPNILLEILQVILLKLSDPLVSRELMTICSGSILTLMAHLQQSLAVDSSPVSGSASVSRSLDSTILAPRVSGTVELFSSSLKAALKHIVNLLLKSSGESTLYRAHIYGALLYCLHVGSPTSQPASSTHQLKASHSDTYIFTKTDPTDTQDSSKFLTECYAILSSYGDSIIDAVFHSACDGHDMNKMLALSVLNMVTSIDRRGDWLKRAVSRGYLQHIVDGLLADDQQLQACLAPQPVSLKALYIFEAKMSFLARLCESAAGASAVLRANTMDKLAALYVFGLRPNINNRPAGDSYMPTIIERYRQHILFPSLKLCLSCMASLGTDSVDATSAVLKFVVSHQEVFCSVLRSVHQLTADQLTELALVTGVVGRAALSEVSTDLTISDAVAMELRGHVLQLRRHMVATLQHYDIVERLRKQLAVAVDTAPLSERMQLAAMTLSAVEIVSNVASFCRALVTKKQVIGRDFSVLFSPNMDYAVINSFTVGVEGNRGQMSNVVVPQSLGLVVAVLRQSVTHFFAVVDIVKQLRHSVDTIADVTADELKKWYREEQAELKTSLRQQQDQARANLKALVRSRSCELDICAHIIENCVYILWRHLEYFLVHSTPGESGTSLYQTNLRVRTPRRLQAGPSDVTGGDNEDIYRPELGAAATLLSREDIAQLKDEAHACLSEQFTKRLVEVEQMYNQERSHHVFVEALVRRIRRLLLLSS